MLWNRQTVTDRVQAIGGFALCQFMRFWMRPLDYRAYYYDSTVDVSRSDFQGPVIYCLWHEYIPIPFYLRSKTNLAILVSRHRDAEWLSRAAELEGFQPFRGSSGRGGVGALKGLCEQQDFPGFVITPDGPRGPRREMAPGAIFMASKLQVPLVLVGLGYQKPWRNRRTWDQFAIPKPGSRARAILSPRVHIPAKISREELEKYRLSAQQGLNELTAIAEQWAQSNQPLPGSHPIWRSPAWSQ